MSPGLERLAVNLESVTLMVNVLKVCGRMSVIDGKAVISIPVAASIPITKV